MNPILERFRQRVGRTSSVQRNSLGRLSSWRENGFDFTVTYGLDNSVLLQGRSGNDTIIEALIFDSFGNYVKSEQDAIPTIFAQELRQSLNSWQSFTNSTLAYPFNSDGIIAAQARVQQNGAGTVLLADAAYTIDKEITPVAGVGFDGVPGALLHTGNIPDSEFLPASGTRLVIDPGVTAFAYNKTDLPSTPNNVGERAISKIRMRGISFIGGYSGIIIGAMREMGATNSVFRDLYFYNQTGPNFSFENFMHCSWGRIYARNTLLSGGGMFFRASLDHLKLIPGNSQIVDEIYSYTPSRNTRSIVFESRNPTEGAQMNEFTVLGRLQVNRFGGSVLTISGTTTNGSADIVVSAGDISTLPIGMPIGFAGSAPSFLDKDTPYYVVANDGVSKIQISKSIAATAGQTISSTGTISMKTNGYPGLEIHGMGGSFTYCHFGLFNDIECANAIVAVSVKETVGACTLGISEIYTAATIRSAINLYGAGALQIPSSASDVSIVSSAGSSPNFIFRGAGQRTLTGNTTLTASHNQSRLDCNSATPMSITVNKGFAPNGFSCEITQIGAGQVTIVAGSGVTINPTATLKTAGQYKRVFLRMTVDDRYNGTETWLLTGDTSA